MGKYAEKTPGKGRGFGMFMIVYAAVILGAAAVGLSLFWNYMEAYENSRINSTLDTYIAQQTPQHKCDRLYYRLKCKQYTRCRLLTFTQLSHEICIRHIVNIGDQHRDHGGDAQ